MRRVNTSNGPWAPAARGGFFLVAAGAALWASDALFRRGLALELPAAVVVFAEHLILVVLTLPYLLRAARHTRRFKRSDWAALLLVGVGASAVATTLFTAAFSYGDVVTPLLLQKLQPLIAVGGARLLLGERQLPRYWFYFASAVASAYLVSFPDPFRSSPQRLAPVLLALGAAALWGAGTVLGRYLLTSIPFADLTVLRFVVGLPATGVIVLIRG